MACPRIRLLISLARHEQNAQLSVLIKETGLLVVGGSSANQANFAWSIVSLKTYTPAVGQQIPKSRDNLSQYHQLKEI